MEIEQTLSLAIPNGNPGSGLTILVGPNNSGKSTIVEGLQEVSSVNHFLPSFAEGKRNKDSGDRVVLSAVDDKGVKLVLKTIAGGGSETEFEELGLKRGDLKIFIIKSRRHFSTYFNKGNWTRELIYQNGQPSVRGEKYDVFAHRLFHMQEHKVDFNKVLEKVLYPLPDWSIEQSDQGTYYLKFIIDKNSHTSEGAGEGILSLFTIIDALYDSKPDDIIVIDEPELSLHPALQKRLLHLLIEYSSDRQIVISTHSPYFISWHSLLNGGTMARVVKEIGNSKIYQISPDASKIVSSVMNNFNNPHILGFDAKEIFFLEDNVIVVEGQEDVVFYRRIAGLLGINIQGDFFGWGIGGAHNLEGILILLSSLGFKKVSCILDKNMQAIKDKVEKNILPIFLLLFQLMMSERKQKLNQEPRLKGLLILVEKG